MQEAAKRQWSPGGKAQVGAQWEVEDESKL